MPELFPRRNRIVAGMSDAVVIIEAARGSGALITAEIASSYNRDVFAVPGRVNDQYSEGCNWLIKTNRAAMVESAKDIEYQLGWELKKNGKPTQKELFIRLNPEEEILVKVLKEKESIHIDDLCRASGLSMNKVSSLLLNLEFAGVVKTLPGKMYRMH
jgi:DNA processing protein